MLYPYVFNSYLFLFFARFYLNSIDSNGHKRALLLPLIHTIAATFLLLIFAHFFESLKLGLRVLGLIKPGFMDLRFWFLGYRILYWKALSIGFDGGKTIGSGIVLISLMVVGTRPENGFCFSINCFFDYLVKPTKLPAALFYFYSYQRFKAFLKVLIHYACFWVIVSV